MKIGQFIGDVVGIDDIKKVGNIIKKRFTREAPEQVSETAEQVRKRTEREVISDGHVTIREEKPRDLDNGPDTGTEPMPRQVNNQSKSIQNPLEEEPVVNDNPVPQKTDAQQPSDATQTTPEQPSETVVQDTTQKEEPTVPRESPKPSEPSDEPAPKDDTKDEKKEEPSEQPKEEKSGEPDDGAQGSETKATSGPVFTKDKKLMGTEDENGNLYMPDEISGSGIGASAKQHKYRKAYKNATEWKDKVMAGLEKMKGSMSAENYEKAQKAIQEQATQYQKDFEKMRADPSEIHAGFSDYVAGNPHASLTVGGGATMGAVVLGLSDSRGQLTNQQLYGQDDLT